MLLKRTVSVCGYIKSCSQLKTMHTRAWDVDGSLHVLLSDDHSCGASPRLLLSLWLFLQPHSRRDEVTLLGANRNQCSLRPLYIQERPNTLQAYGHITPWDTDRSLHCVSTSNAVTSRLPNLPGHQSSSFIMLLCTGLWCYMDTLKTCSLIYSRWSYLDTWWLLL